MYWFFSIYFSRKQTPTGIPQFDWRNCCVFRWHISKFWPTNRHPPHFIYDSIYINQGNAYNKYTGIFIVPTTGVYAFLWTVAAEGNKGPDNNYGEIGTELVVNSTPRARVHVDTETAADDTAATGFVILHLKADMNSDILLQTAAIFFSNELLSETGYWLSVCHGWFHLHGLPQAARSGSEVYKTKNSF